MSSIFFQTRNTQKKREFLSEKRESEMTLKKREFTPESGSVDTYGCSSLYLPTAPPSSYHSPSLFHFVVTFRATVPKTPVELIGSKRLSTPSIHPTLANSLLATINLMADCASARSRFPSEPLDSHLPERLCILWTELVSS